MILHRIGFYVLKIWGTKRHILHPLHTCFQPPRQVSSSFSAKSLNEKEWPIDSHKTIHSFMSVSAVTPPLQIINNSSLFYLSLLKRPWSFLPFCYSSLDSILWAKDLFMRNETKQEKYLEHSTDSCNVIVFILHRIFLSLSGEQLPISFFSDLPSAEMTCLLNCPQWPLHSFLKLCPNLKPNSLRIIQIDSAHVGYFLLRKEKIILLWVGIEVFKAWHKRVMPM